LVLVLEENLNLKAGGSVGEGKYFPRRKGGEGKGFVPLPPKETTVLFAHGRKGRGG